MWKKRAILTAWDLGRFTAKGAIAGWIAGWALGVGLDYGAARLVTEVRRQEAQRQVTLPPPAPVRIMAPDEA